jgi:hypothetical protein
MRGLEAFFLLLTQKAQTQTHTASQSARARARARTHLAHLALAPCRPPWAARARTMREACTAFPLPLLLGAALALPCVRFAVATCGICIRT